MRRLIEPEFLDALPPADPRALHSRGDLQRVNAWMGNHSIMARTLLNNFNRHAPKQITELGAGDGNFLRRVAQTISPRWPNVNVTLLDRQKIATAQTLDAFARLGWRAEIVVADVFDWPQIGNPAEVVIANLFLHHFEDAPLAGLLHLISRRAKLFIALEPRRACWPLFCSRLLWTMGCNDVTRHDAAVSVRAGFAGKELSALWPHGKNWRLTERRAGLFGHLFITRRIE